MKDAIDIRPDDPRIAELQQIFRENASWGVNVTILNILAWHDNQKHDEEMRNWDGE